MSLSVMLRAEERETKRSMSVLLVLAVPLRNDPFGVMPARCVPA
jgi:hypothetical protein